MSKFPSVMLALVQDSSATEAAHATEAPRPLTKYHMTLILQIHTEGQDNITPLPQPVLDLLMRGQKKGFLVQKNILTFKVIVIWTLKANHQTLI